jgi:hypothetical protein
MNAMPTKALKAKIVNVKVTEGRTGLFYATSPELRGLLVTEPTLDALEVAIPRAITDMYAVCGVEVVVTRVEDGSPEYQPWVAVPVVIAKKALEAVN